MEDGTLLPLTGLVTTGLTGLLVYRLIRRKPPTHVQVNCWFCNQNTVVPYGNRNCWDCPTCEQYNGFQENGDYNKPIPAQHSEHLNHLVTGGSMLARPVKPQQWVNCQLLVCKKCNSNQATKIKKLASFSPRDEDRYDEEIEVYKHHLEQIYKMCRPCQTAVECYIKHQNRQLRALMVDHQFRHQALNKGYVQSFASLSCTRVPVKVIFLRCLAFLSCALLVSMACLGSRDLFSPSIKDTTTNSQVEAWDSTAPDDGHRSLFEKILNSLPALTVERLNEAWRFGQNHQIGLVTLGLLACVFAMILAGRIMMRRVDVFSSFLWMLVTGLYLVDSYQLMEPPTWMDAAKLGATSLCCLVGLTSAMVTRKATRQRRHLPGRCLSAGPPAPFGNMNSYVVRPEVPTPVLSTPPGLLHLVNLQDSPPQRKVSHSSLPRRLNRALSLGTTPSLVRLDSGSLFSGSRPASQSSAYKYSPGSDYFSMLSGSYTTSPLPSPTPSVAGSATSSAGSLYNRRPLISPARFNLHGQKPDLSPTWLEATQNHHNYKEMYLPDSSQYPQHFTPILAKSHNDIGRFGEARSVSSNKTYRREDNSSYSSACQVDTTTAFLDHPSSWKGYGGMSLSCGCLVLSVIVNAIFVSTFLYRSRV